MYIEIPFQFGDKVFIKPLKKDGRVVSLIISKYGTEVKVKHVNGDKIEYDDFFLDELEPVHDSTCGFQQS